MLDTDKIPADIIADIANNLGYDEDKDGSPALDAYLPQIKNMSSYQAIDCWMTWHLGPGWTVGLIRVVDTIREAQEQEPGSD